MEKPEEAPEAQVAKQKRAQEDKKRATVYLKSRVEELDRSMAQHFAKGNFALASHDARRLVAIFDMLAEIDVT